MTGSARLGRDPADLAHVVDVVVIGGGITGVQVAREAAGRGLRVALFERGDVGGGTSSATTKYLHGGIRYLEQRQFGVVRESLRERRVLALGAPHLVEQRRFLMPGWRWSRPSMPLIGAGVALYTAMAFDRNRDAPASLRIPMPRWVSPRALRAEVPWLDPVGLQGAFAYHDTLNVHPERLLLAYVRDAVALGAVVRTHTSVEGFVTDAGRVTGVDVVDMLTGDRHTVRARTVVNAAGPSIDLVLRPLESDEQRRIERPLGVRVQRSKGVHVFTRPLGGTSTVFCRARTGSHVVVSPWQGGSFIGPTDTPTDELPSEVRARRDDVEQVLATVNATLAPEVAPLTVDDVEATTVGIRPLIDHGTDTYRASRRHEVFDHSDAGAAALWSIGGGKWTTGRATAEVVIDTVLASPHLAGVRTRPFESERRAVTDAFGWAEEPEPFLHAAASRTDGSGLDPEVRLHLARLYGTDHERVVDLAASHPSLADRLSNRPGRLDIAAQAVHAVTDEGACTLADVVDRRLVLGTLGRVTGDELRRVAEVIAPLLGWSSEQSAAEAALEATRRAAVERAWRT